MKNLNPLYENLLDLTPKVIRYSVKKSEEPRKKFKKYVNKKISIYKKLKDIRDIDEDI